MSKSNFSTYIPSDNGAKGFTVTSTPEYRRAMALMKSSKGLTAQKPKLGKAGLKSNQGPQGGPEHIYREPRLKQKIADIVKVSTTIEDRTRSTIKRMAERTAYVATVEDLLAYATKQCKARVVEIIAECEANGKKFFDKSFFYGSRNSLYPPGSPDDCTVTEPTCIARLSDIFPGHPLYDTEGAGSYDILQGAVGDCFFIGAVSALACTTAQAMNPVGRVFAHYSTEWGVYGVCFTKNGGWEWVIVDDFIATQPDGKTPLYAQAAGAELWPYIIEKAYAKVHYCWDTIDGGWGREALADLTGGLEFTVDLNGPNKGMSFEEFRRWVDDPMTILGCALGNHVEESGGPAGHAGETGAVFGLFKGHAYSVLRATQTSDGVGFVRVRNPWGNDSEWNGPYSDNSDIWKKKQLHFKELAPQFKDDGAFWMTWDDFKKYFTDIDICKFFSPKLKCITMFSSSKGSNALKPDNAFILEVKSQSERAKIVTTLGQEDSKSQPDHPKAKGQPYAVLCLSIYELTAVPKSFNEMPKCLGKKMETSRTYNRQVDETLNLKPGLYSLVPKLTEAPSGVGFYVRCFCDPEDDMTIYRYDNKEGTLLSTLKPGGSRRATPVAAPAPAESAPLAASGSRRVTPSQTALQLPAAPGSRKPSGRVDPPQQQPAGSRKPSGNSTVQNVIVKEGEPVPVWMTVGGGYGAITTGQGQVMAPSAEKPSQPPPRPAAAPMSSALGGINVPALFQTEGGVETACKHAFTRTDTWNRGSLDRRSAEVAFSQLLMSSEIGRSFQELLYRSGVFQMTKEQFTMITQKALRNGTTL